MSEVIPDHQECIDLLLPEKIKNNVAFTLTEPELPNSVSLFNINP